MSVGVLLGGLPVALIHTENTLHPGVSITDNEVGINTTEHVHCLYVVHVYMYIYKCGELPSAPGSYEPPRVENV